MQAQILAPFSNKKEVVPLIEAGATELYCGLVDKKWQQSYSFVSSINLRHDRAANLVSFKELQHSIEEAHSMNSRVFLTLNAHFYSQPQLPIVLKQAEKAIKAGIDSLIVADSSLIPKLKQEFSVPISLSTGNPAFNNSALDFFKELGIERVVFPRHLSLNEIEQLTSHSKKIGLTTECFVLNVICPYIDGLCTFQHIVDESVEFLPLGGLPCRYNFNVKAFSKASKEKKLAAESHINIWGNTLSRDCGLCALPYFKRFGVDSLKIAGRAHPIEKKLADVMAVKNALDFLDSKGAEAFAKKCRQLYFDLFHNKCDYINCYYPGAGFE